MKIDFLSDGISGCELVNVVGTELDVVNAARVSLHKESDWSHTDSSKSGGVLNDKDIGLINFLMKNKHGTPFEMGFQATFRLRMPIFVAREHVRHRIGHCLTGDTEVWLETITENSGRTVRKRRLDWLYKNWHEGVTDSMGRTRILPACKNLSMRVLNEDTQLFELGTMLDIFKSGEKAIYQLETVDGHILKASGNHPIWTDKGYVRMDELDPAEHLIGVVGKRNKNKREVSAYLRGAIGVWTTQQRDILLSGDADYCYECEELFPVDDLDLDHIIPVVKDLTKALDIKNLAPICEDCHKSKTSGEQSLTRELTAGSKFVSMKSEVTYVADEMTYDIEMSEPWHNFVANGIIVHNSINEESGRYVEMRPDFYIPKKARTQVGKPGAYTFEEDVDYVLEGEFLKELEFRSKETYKLYKYFVDEGIAKEQARLLLPLNLYTEMLWTCNARSLMNYLELRAHKDAQQEIRLMADTLEGFFCVYMPNTWEAFNKERVAP